MAALTVDDFKIIIYTIRNVYDPDVFKNKVVYPEALNNQKTAAKDRYTLKWDLSKYNHFRSFHQVLWPLSMYTATKKFNLRRKEALKHKQEKYTSKLGLESRIKFTEATKKDSTLRRTHTFGLSHPTIDLSNKYLYANNKNMTSILKSET